MIKFIAYSAEPDYEINITDCPHVLRFAWMFFITVRIKILKLNIR